MVLGKSYFYVISLIWYNLPNHHLFFIFIYNIQTLIVYSLFYTFDNE